MTPRYHGSTISGWQQNQRRRRLQGERQKNNMFTLKYILISSAKFVACFNSFFSPVICPPGFNVSPPKTPYEAV